MITALRTMAREDGRLWLCAYVASLLIPLMLMAHRGVADALCVVVGLLFLWHSHKSRNWRWLSDPVIRIGLLAWLWMLLVVTPLAHAPLSSLAGAAPWVRYLLLYAALTQWVLVRPGALRLLATLWVFILLAVQADTLWQYLTGVSLSGHPISMTGRLSGPLDSVKVGLFLTKLALPIGGLYLFFALREGSKPRVVLGIFFLFAALAIVQLSGERIAFLSAFAAIALMMLLMGVWEPRFRSAGIIGLLALMLAVLTLFLTQNWVQERALEFYGKLAHFKISNYGQLLTAGYTIGLENWATGAGLKGFRALCPELELRQVVHYCNLHPHNPYIEWFAETGALGLALFFALIGAWLHRAVTWFAASGGIQRLLPAAALATLLVHFFPLMVTQSQFSNWPAILLWYSLGIAFAGIHLKADEHGNHPARS